MRRLYERNGLLIHPILWIRCVHQYDYLNNFLDSSLVRKTRKNFMPWDQWKHGSLTDKLQTAMTEIAKERKRKRKNE